MAITILNNKGKILSVLAGVTKHSKVRQLFGRTIGLFSAGKIKKLSDVSKNK